MGFQSEKGDRSSCHALFDTEQTSGNAKIQDPEFRGPSANRLGNLHAPRDSAAIASKKLRS